MHQSCRILESNAEAMENYIVVSSEQYWNEEAESKRHTAALASSTRLSPGNPVRMMKSHVSTLSPLGRNLLLPLANKPLAATPALPLNAPAVCKKSLPRCSTFCRLTMVPT